MATSPTAHAVPLNNPKKRPSTSNINSSTIQSTTSIKRPKHSHPLRQTSFSHPASAPPSEAGSSTSKPAGKRNRGRPKKQPSQAALSPPPPNLNTTQHPTPNFHPPAATTAPRSVVTDHPSPPSDDELDLDLPTNLPLGTEADLASERAQLATLQDALSPVQNARYAAYKNTKLKSTTLKRIVNQVVSQSVTAIPLQSVQWVAKVFLGEVVEGARRVQDEWANSWDEEMAERRRQQRRNQQLESADQGGGGNAGREGREEEEEEEEEAAAHSTVEAVISPAAAQLLLPTSKIGPTPSPPPSASLPHPQSFYGPTANPHRGGLLPSHLREAVRRAQVAGEFGGVGAGGWSHGGLGVQGEAVARVGLGMGMGVGNGGGGRFFR